MLFEVLDRVLHSKKKIEHNIGDDPIHPYIMNRWISMYSTQLCTVINNTGNWLYSVFDTHQQYYKFLQTFLPRVATRRIHYIKKTKQEQSKTTDETNDVDVLSHNLELSKREIKCLIEYERQHRPINPD